MKTCFKCLCSKPLDCFYKHSRMKDGHINKCIDCAKLDVSNNRSKNIEQIREYDRARSKLPHRKELARRVRTEWINNNPQARSAQVRVNNALRDGRIQRMACEICGGMAQAHHPDYSRPLLVTWLCAPHHKQAHAQTKQLVF